MRIGIFGGSFNPVHHQHLTIARAARDQQNLDEVWFIPVFQPVHKNADDFLSYEARRNLLASAILKESGLKICDAEKELGGLSFTVRTVNYLQSKFPDYQFSLLIGGDSLTELSSWRSIDELVKLVDFVVVERPGFPRKSPLKDARLHWVETGLSGMSASKIRENLRKGIFSLEELEEETCFQILRNNYFASLGNGYSELLKKINTRLEEMPPGLSSHIEMVTREAFHWAIVGKTNPSFALIAGLSHDLFRCAEQEEIFKYANRSGYEFSELEKSVPMLAHGLASAGFLVSEVPEISHEILDAVRFHTFPRIDSGVLTQILVVSDTLEPSRKLEERESLRQQNLSLKEKYLKVLALKEASAREKNCGSNSA